MVKTATLTMATLLAASLLAPASANEDCTQAAGIVNQKLINITDMYAETYTTTRKYQLIAKVRNNTQSCVLSTGLVLRMQDCDDAGVCNDLPQYSLGITGPQPASRAAVSPGETVVLKAVAAVDKNDVFGRLTYHSETINYAEAQRKFSEALQRAADEAVESDAPWYKKVFD